MADENEKEEKEISPKHQRFVDEYVKCWNGTQAYKVVYPKCTDYAARTGAAKLLTNSNVQAYLKIILDESHMSANEALQNMADMARGDVSDVVDDQGYFDFEKARLNGKTRLIKKIRRKITTSIHGVVTEDVEFEMYDAQAANDKILRVHGKYQDNLDIKSGGKPIVPITVIEVIKSNE